MIGRDITTDSLAHTLYFPAAPTVVVGVMWRRFDLIADHLDGVFAGGVILACDSILADLGADHGLQREAALEQIARCAQALGILSDAVDDVIAKFKAADAEPLGLSARGRAVLEELKAARAAALAIVDAPAPTTTETP